MWSMRLLTMEKVVDNQRIVFVRHSMGGHRPITYQMMR